MRTLLLLVMFGFSLAASAQTKSDAAGSTSTDVLKPKEAEFDFGRIPQGRPVTHVFEVVNNGKDTVSITNVQASCGCTTPQWNKEPIAPGKSTLITVGYNAAAEGPFTKGIYIQANGSQIAIVIKGDVYKTASTPAPLNASIQLLKNINQ